METESKLMEAEVISKVISGLATSGPFAIALFGIMYLWIKRANARVDTLENRIERMQDAHLRDLKFIIKNLDMEEE